MIDLPSLSSRERAIRQRLKDDLEHYAARCLKIRTKAGRVEPLLFNRTQQYLHAKIEDHAKRRTGGVSTPLRAGARGAEHEGKGFRNGR